WQGSWTDVYSLAAVCYRALTGTTPVEWKQRGNGRELIPARAIRGEVPENISNALMTALSVDLRNRYRTVDEFWIGLLHGPGDGTAVYQLPIEERTALPVAAARRNGPFLALMITLVMLLVAVLSVNLIQILIGPREPAPVEGAESSALSATEPGSEPMAESAPAVAPTMPDFVGMSVERVFQSYSAQFAFDISYIYAEQEAFEVVGQRPKAGEPVALEQRVLLEISKGSERTAMPQVIGLPLEEAQELLEAQNIAYQVEVLVDLTHEDGTVVWASHEYGSILYRSTETVTIRVARKA
ncbi:MAG: PASTA domain-containing protein, partial [Oscillospiraceae bacterium]